MRPRVLDLFSGIGGFSLGLERAGFETVAFCEIDPWCQRVLGLPKTTTKATLRLEVGELPRLEVECFEVPLRVVTDPETGARSIASVRFMLRLEPFSPTEKDQP